MFISSLIFFADKAMIHDLPANFQVDYACVITITFFYHNQAHCVDQAQHTTICDLSCVEGMTSSIY